MNELQKIESFRQSLAIAETIEEIKLIGDAAAAYAELLRRQNVGYESQNKLGEFRVEVDAKKGEWLNKYYPHGGDEKHKLSKLTNGKLRKMPVAPRESSDSRLLKAATDQQIKQAQEIIISRKQVVEPKKIANELRAKVKQEAIEQKIKDIEEGNLPEIDGLFDVVVIDPPWNYGRAYDPQGSRVASPYPEMSLSEIKSIELPVKDDSILFLWTTHQFLPHSFDILQYWGFDYKATIVWDKEKLGMGHWVRMQCEFCLLAIKGEPLWINTQHRDIIREPRRDHSRKPEQFYKIIDEITFGRKLDYFSRKTREGWTAYGTIEQQ